MCLTNEQLANINKTLRKQRDDAEVKVKILASLIDDDLWDNLDATHQDIAITVMKDIDV